jgi:hypothetical protein
MRRTQFTENQVSRLLLVILSFLSIACSKELPVGYHIIDGSVVYSQFAGPLATNDSKTVEGADPDSFIALNEFYGKDKTSVFFSGERVEADVASFQVLPPGAGVNFPWFGRDTKTIFRADEAMSHDPEKFEFLDLGYARDSEHVYYVEDSAQPIDLADPSTFTVLDPSHEHRGEDRLATYQFGHRTPKDSVSPSPKPSSL